MITGRFLIHSHFRKENMKTLKLNQIDLQTYFGTLLLSYLLITV